MVINECQENNAKEYVGLNTISGTVTQMKPEYSTIRKRCDENLNESCNWATARYNLSSRFVFTKAQSLKEQLIAEYSGEDKISNEFNPD